MMGLAMGSGCRLCLPPPIQMGIPKCLCISPSHLQHLKTSRSKTPGHIVQRGTRYKGNAYPRGTPAARTEGPPWRHGQSVILPSKHAFQEAAT